MTVTSAPPPFVQAPLVVHNLHGPQKNPKIRHATIESFLKAAKGGFGGFNELNPKDKRVIETRAAVYGLKIYIFGLNGAVWDPKVATAGKPRVKKIMQGGHVGADGVATPKKGDDDRRVGPSRFGIYITFTMVAFDLEWEFDVTHLVARWQTVARWRVNIANRSIVSLAQGVVDDDGILVGDMNSRFHINLPGLNEIPVKSAATMGKAIYDQVLKWGKHIYVSPMRAVNTGSDHHMLVGMITFYREARANFPASTPPARPVPKPANPTKLPKPGTPKVNWKKYGSPVAHPWANRSARFKRRPLWTRIVKWQTAYRKRLL